MQFLIDESKIIILSIKTMIHIKMIHHLQHIEAIIGLILNTRY